MGEEAVTRPVPHHGPMDQASLWFTDKQADENADQVQKKRLLYEQRSCKAEDDKAFIFDWFTPPTRAEKSTVDIVKPCMFTFLDFGANVGDSLGKLIDAGVDARCTGRYSVVDGKMLASSAPENKLTIWTREMMEKFSATHVKQRKGQVSTGFAQPENYCYFGVEGNPVFTAQLKELQQRVLQSTPRPVRSAHFFTETVASGAGDGPTVLYLDTVNGKNNFFGSSLLPDHTDVRNSAVAGKPMSAPVQGVTLSTMLKQTVKHQAGAHIIIKIDIEGAEYAVLNEAYDSGALCDCVATGVRVDIRVEIHPKVRIFDGGQQLVVAAVMACLTCILFCRKPLVRMLILIVSSIKCGKGYRLVASTLALRVMLAR
jgi:Methyltransferase FkbM domain